MKRQRSRNRSGSSGGGGNKPQQNANRAFESNGPDNVKVRGHAQSVFEKYQQLARDATSSGDRVLAENYLQHAEHYFRVLRAVQPNRPVTEIMGRDAFSSGLDIDFEDEALNQPAPEAQEGDGVQSDGGGEARFEQRPETRSDQQRNEQPRQDYNREPRRDYSRDRNDRGDAQRYEGRREEQPRGEQPRSDRPDYRRDERPRDERPRDDRPRDDRPRYEPRRDERPRDDKPRDDRRDRYEPRGERNGERAPPPAGDPLQVVQPEATPFTSAPAIDEASPVLRGQDGAVSHAPAFLQGRAEAPAPDDAPAAPAKRPRARRKPYADAPAPAEAAEEA